MRHTKAINLIKEFEGFRAEAYYDGGGVLTIGWGRTANVKVGDITTKEKEEIFVEKEVDYISKKILSYIPEKVELNENQLCALICLCYNIGLGAFSKSTLLKLLKENKKISAGKEILKWHKDNGKAVQGLIRRRIAELHLYEQLV